MGWLQLSLVAHRDQSASIEAALENGGALAVTIDDAADDLAPEPILEPAPNATPLWRQVRITALFSDDPNGAMLAEQAARSLGPQSLAPPLTTTLDDRPWERVWLEELAPMRFGRRLWICPHGQRPEADAGSVIIDLDPGLAFGTGHHPTTGLCLRWLDGLDLKDRTVLDFGCGSGILAIAALKLGARRAVAVDHDQQALDATIDNAVNNGVADRLTVLMPEQMPQTTPPHPPKHSFSSLPDTGADVIVANILAGPLIELAPTLTRFAAQQALIGLSGILSHQADPVAEAYGAHFLLDPPEIESDWVLLAGRRLRA
ncbi:MAG: 50S ribosomal protein L11 methyltransferase [Thiohalocapsa sp.]